MMARTARSTATYQRVELHGNVQQDVCKREKHAQFAKQEAVESIVKEVVGIHPSALT